MSIEQAFAQTELVKPSDNSHLRNESSYKPERKHDYQADEPERFSETMKRKSQEANDDQRVDPTDRADDRSGNEGAIQNNQNRPDKLDQAELAQDPPTVPGMSAEQSLDLLNQVLPGLPTTDTMLATGEELPTNPDGIVLNDLEAGPISLLTTDGQTAALTAGTQEQQNQTVNLANPQISTTHPEKTAESAMPVNPNPLDSNNSLNIGNNTSALGDQTATEEVAPAPLLDQESNLSSKQGQTQNQIPTTNNESQDAQAEEESFRPLVNQGSQQNVQSQNNSVVGTNQNGIAIQDLQAVNNNSKPEIMQTPAQQDMNAMDKAVGKQIERSIVQQLQNGQKVLQVRLTPPELGTVRVEIIEQNGRMSVRLQAEDDSVRHSLEKVLPQLRNDIRAGNAPIAEIQLTDHSLFMNQRHAQQQQQQRRQRQGAPQFSLDNVQQTQNETNPAPAKDGITINQQGVSGMI